MSVVLQQWQFGESLQSAVIYTWNTAEVTNDNTRLVFVSELD